MGRGAGRRGGGSRGGAEGVITTDLAATGSSPPRCGSTGPQDDTDAVFENNRVATRMALTAAYGSPSVDDVLAEAAEPWNPFYRAGKPGPSKELDMSWEQSSRDETSPVERGGMGVEVALFGIVALAIGAFMHNTTKVKIDWTFLHFSALWLIILVVLLIGALLDRTRQSSCATGGMGRVRQSARLRSEVGAGVPTDSLAQRPAARPSVTGCFHDDLHRDPPVAVDDTARRLHLDHRLDVPRGHTKLPSP